MPHIHRRVTRDLIAWEAAADAPADTSFQLLHSAGAGLGISGDAVSGADDAAELTREPAGLPRAARLKFPHLANLPVLRLTAEAAEAAPQLLRCQLAVAATGPDGKLLATTGMHLHVCDCITLQPRTRCRVEGCFLEAHQPTQNCMSYAYGITFQDAEAEPHSCWNCRMSSYPAAWQCCRKIVATAHMTIFPVWLCQTSA